MGNFSDNYMAKKDCEERDFKTREKIAGFFFDLAKLVFAAMVLGGLTPVMGWIRRHGYEFVLSSIFATEVLFLIGYKILK